MDLGCLGPVGPKPEDPCPGWSPTGLQGIMCSIKKLFKILAARIRSETVIKKQYLTAVYSGVCFPFCTMNFASRNSKIRRRLGVGSITR